MPTRAGWSSSAWSGWGSPRRRRPARERSPADERRHGDDAVALVTEAVDDARELVGGHVVLAALVAEVHEHHAASRDAVLSVTWPRGGSQSARWRCVNVWLPTS